MKLFFFFDREFLSQKASSPVETEWGENVVFLQSPQIWRKAEAAVSRKTQSELHMAGNDEIPPLGQHGDRQT